APASSGLPAITHARPFRRALACTPPSRMLARWVTPERGRVSPRRSAPHFVHYEFPLFAPAHNDNKFLMTHPDHEAGLNGPSGVTAEAQDNAAELLDLLRRERADFLNYKRRVERELADDRERTRADVLQRLLPLLDEFDRALAHVPPELEANAW